MQIALINHYAGSPRHGMEYRPYYLGREWTASGHRVTVLAANHSHLRRVNPDKGTTDEEIDGIFYRWTCTGEYVGNGPKRVINMLQFVNRLYWEAPALNALLRPDVVIASSTYPLDIVVAHRLSRLAKARLIFEVHDLWPLSPIQIGGMSRAHPFIMLMQWAENYALRHADQVVSMLPYAKPHLVAHGMADHKFHYVPNGFYAADWSSAAEKLDEATARQIGSIRQRYPFLVGYAGSHGASNVLSPFLEAAPLVRSHGIALVLAGQGPEKSGLIQRAKDHGWDNVLFLEALPKRQIPALLENFDAVFIGWRAIPLYRFGVSPNKLFDYMMSGRPVIHAIDSPENLVAEARCGLTVRAESPTSAAEACIALLRMPELERRTLGKNGRDFVVKNHDYGRLARRFEQILAN